MHEALYIADARSYWNVADGQIASDDTKVTFRSLRIHVVIRRS